MANDEEQIIQLRIDVGVLQKTLVLTEKALDLAHKNTLTWVGLAVALTAVIVKNWH